MEVKPVRRLLVRANAREDALIQIKRTLQVNWPLMRCAASATQRSLASTSCDPGEARIQSPTQHPPEIRAEYPRDATLDHLDAPEQERDLAYKIDQNVVADISAGDTA